MSRLYKKTYAHNIKTTGRGHETGIFPKKYTNGKQTHEKMSNISNHQVNANQNHSEISPHPYQNTIMTKMKNN